MNENILAPLNQCEHTGLEQVIKVMTFGDGRVEVYIDNFGKKRILYLKKGEKYATSALWLDVDGTILWKYTDEHDRGNGYTRQLQCAASVMGIKWKQSKYMTEAGKACY